MTRQLNRLTARAVLKLKKPGRHADGGNLYLKITRLQSTALSKSFTFMYLFEGKQREAGIGSCGAITLAEARAKAAEHRSLLLIDPLTTKHAATVARKTFGECAAALIASKRREWRSEVHAGQWRTTIDDYCGTIRDVPVDAIDTAAVLSVLQPLWARIPETASRLRGRIEAVLDYAKAHGLRSGENPAAWRGHLALILPKRGKLSHGHHAALPYSDVPELVARLRETETIQTLALEFLILTAGRSGEVLGATWDEIDTDAQVWVIPASRMKAGCEHRVPLSARAIAIIERMAETRSGDFVFPGQRRRRPLSGSAIGALVPDGVTVHGFRSSFRDWCGNETSFPREIAEQALAHAAGGAVERAYRRLDALEKRRALMQAWAKFCEPRDNDNVVRIRKAN